MSAEFAVIYNRKRKGNDTWLKIAVDEIYELCKVLAIEERAAIRNAFLVNNNIEDLCEGRATPIEIGTLSSVVEKKMKPLLVKFYSDLIRAKEKLDYYNRLITQNSDFASCPCCSLLPIESATTHYREDNDHYLPKAEYPFASVNFSNLVPLCSKCNKKCKSTKNPFENARKSFFAFKPLDHQFEITASIIDTLQTDYLVLKPEEVDLTFNNDVAKVDTWHWLFEIKTRYVEDICKFSKSELRALANRIKRDRDRKQGQTYETILNDAIEDYEFDKYDDRKFLKMSFIRAMLSKQDWMAVYLV
jgi:hypothetical protein